MREEKRQGRSEREALAKREKQGTTNLCLVLTSPMILLELLKLIFNVVKILVRDDGRRGHSVDRRRHDVRHCVGVLVGCWVVLIG